MSDSEGDETTEFRCRKCNKTFTAAEKDAHRQMHRDERAAKKSQPRPGPKSKTRKSVRAASPTNETDTIFDPVPVRSPTPEPPKKGAKRGRKADKDDEPPSKRKSKKNYDNGVIGGWTKGNGA